MQSIVNGVLCLASIILASMLFAGLYKKIHFIKLTVLGFVGAIFYYIVAGGILFPFNTFGITKALVLGIALEVLSLLCLLFWKNISVKRLFTWKRYKLRREDAICSAVLLVICLTLLPFTWGKSGMHGMKQDQGGYQIKAMALMSGYTDNYIDFPEYDDIQEYDEITNAAIQSDYLTNIRAVEGYYMVKEDFGDKMAPGYSDIVGVLHGIPTYPALLALWGSIFGMKQMMQFGTFTLFLAVFMMYYLGESMGFKKGVSLAISLLFAFSPIVIWLSKNTLTEPVLTIIIMFYFLTLLDAKLKAHRWLSGVPIIVFAYFNTTLYTLMPMFVCINLALFFANRNRQYLTGIILSLLGYGTGYFAMMPSSRRYIVDNYQPLYGITKGLVTRENLPYVIVGVSVFLTIVCVVLMILPVHEKKKSAVKKRKTQTVTVRKRILWWAIRIVTIAFIAYQILYEQWILQGQWKRLQFTTAGVYIIMTGFIILPLVYGFLVFKPQIFTAKKNRAIILFGMLYCVVIYCIIFRPTINYFYYYSRYVMPFLPIILLAAGICLNYMHMAPAVVIALAATGMMIYPFDVFQISNQDNTMLEWDKMEGVLDTVEENSAVVVGEGDEVYRACMIIPLKTMKNCDIYYVYGKLEEELALLSSQYANVYYLDSALEPYEEEYPLEVVYQEENWSSYYTKNHLTDDMTKKEKLVLLPDGTKVYELQGDLTVYQYIE